MVNNQLQILKKKYMNKLTLKTPAEMAIMIEGGKKIAEVKAVEGVSLQVGKGKTVGIVGESGSGKTTVAKCIVRLVVPTAGRILFEGADLCQIGGEQLRYARKHMQMIFQDPYTSLNPLMKVGDIVVEPLMVLGIFLLFP